MAGTIPLSLSQQIDINGAPLARCLLYTFVVGTVATPQNTYQDYGLSIVNPNPLPADQAGRIPMFYLADGQVHVRLTDASGVVLVDVPNMQVIGPSSGGGGGGGPSIDPTTIASTGDIKFRSTSETLTGWVKLNSQTIGSAASGAAQRANADTQNLFVYLWQNFTDAHCAVSGGRGVNALADFMANKKIGLPDWRGRTPSGLDDMGAAAAGVIQAGNVTSGGGDGVTTPGAAGGESNHTLVVAETPAGQITLTDPGHVHRPGEGTHFLTTNLGSFQLGGASGYQQAQFTPTATALSTTGIALTDNAGGQSHNNMQPFVLVTWYIHL